MTVPDLPCSMRFDPCVFEAWNPRGCRATLVPTAGHNISIGSNWIQGTYGVAQYSAFIRCFDRSLWNKCALNPLPIS